MEGVGMWVVTSCRRFGGQWVCFTHFPNKVSFFF
jgi:hypothetical protein